MGQAALFGAGTILRFSDYDCHENSGSQSGTAAKRIAVAVSVGVGRQFNSGIPDGIEGGSEARIRESDQGHLDGIRSSMAADGSGGEYADGRSLDALSRNASGNSDNDYHGRRDVATAIMTRYNIASTRKGAGLLFPLRYQLRLL